MTQPQAVTPRIRAVVVDDEELGRDRIQSLLAQQSDVDVVGVCADGPSAVEDPNPELRWHRAPAAADEELHSQLGLQLVHVPGYVRLHRVQAVGGGRERALLRHREQRFELANVHRDASVSGLHPGSCALGRPIDRF